MDLRYAPVIPERDAAFQPVNLRQIHGTGPPALPDQPEALRQKHKQQACRQHLGPAKSFTAKESDHGEPASVLPWRGTNQETSRAMDEPKNSLPGELDEVSPATAPPAIASDANPGFALTKPSPLEEKIQKVFIGRDGLRPVWRLVLYLSSCTGGCGSVCLCCSPTVCQTRCFSGGRRRLNSDSLSSPWLQRS